MSYDLTIRSEDDYSRYAKVEPLAAFIATLPEMRPNGEGFTFGDDASRYMEIDFEAVNEDGDNIEEHGKDYREINRVALHIPYSMLGNQPERAYLPTAFAIANYLGWRVFDEQRGEYLDPAGK